MSSALHIPRTAAFLRKYRNFGGVVSLGRERPAGRGQRRASGQRCRRELNPWAIGHFRPDAHPPAITALEDSGIGYLDDIRQRREAIGRVEHLRVNWMGIHLASIGETEHSQTPGASRLGPRGANATLRDMMLFSGEVGAEEALWPMNRRTHR